MLSMIELVKIPTFLIYKLHFPYLPTESSERSLISILKRLKKYLRNTIGDNS